MPYKISPTLTVWSPSKAQVALDCLGMFLFEYIFKEKSPKTVPMAIGTFCHSRAEKFDKEVRKPSGELKSKESYANSCGGLFHRTVLNTENIQGRPIHFYNDGQKFRAKHLVKEIAAKQYDDYINDLFVIAREIDRLAPELGGLNWRGIVDEIRTNEKGEIILRDHKKSLGLLSDRYMSYGSHQPTIYIAVFCYICKVDYAFRKMVGIPDEIAETWGGEPRFVDPRVIFEYRDMVTGKIYPTRRTDHHFLALAKELKGLEPIILEMAEFFKEGDKDAQDISKWGNVFSPSWDSCRRCFHREGCDDGFEESLERTIGYVLGRDFKANPRFVPYEMPPRQLKLKLPSKAVS